MEHSFDPYWHWLAIPPEEQPPNHYRLLGLRLFEADPQRVAAAVRSRTSFVRACDDGTHPEAVGELIQRIEAAGRTLADPRRKQQYDDLLREQLKRAPAMSADAAAGGAGHKAAVPEPPPVWTNRTPEVRIIEAPPRQLPSVVPSPPVARPRARPRLVSWWFVLVGSLSMLAALLAAAALWPVPQQPQGQPSALHRGATSRPPAGGRSRRWPEQGAATASGRRPASDKTGQKPSGETRRSSPATGAGRSEASATAVRRSPTRWDHVPGPIGPVTLADLLEQTDRADVEPEMVRGMMGGVIEALRQRNVAGARHRLSSIRGIATVPQSLRWVTQADTLLSAVNCFWNAVAEAMDELETAEELQVGQARVLVVDVQRGKLTLRSAGQNRRYTRSNMPCQLAIALAERRLDSEQPDGALAIGAFLAVDRDGDRQRARRYMEQAGPDGAAILEFLESLSTAARQKTPERREKKTSGTDEPAPPAAASSPDSATASPR